VNARATLVIAVVLVLAVAASVWAIPTVTGPEVECGELDRAVCEEVLRDHVRETTDWGLAGFLPITRLSVAGATNEEPTCGTFTIERLWGWMGRIAIRDCS
jgi:hypothetical protein